MSLPKNEGVLVSEKLKKAILFNITDEKILPKAIVAKIRNTFVSNQIKNKFASKC